MRVIWAPSALQELLEIYRYVAAQNPAAARRLVDNLIAAGNSLMDFPRRGRPVGDDVRELVAVRPYIIQYEVTAGEVTILRVRHSSRRP
ncbi:MAG TPA: type II toxin-antitoxin system RelE/ParE family toxin [Stellaceae bacterium]